MKRFALLFLAASVAHVACAADAAPTEKAAPLHVLAKARGIAFGTAVAARPLENDATYREVLAREFSIITAENELKWATTRPAEDKFNFAPADRIVEFAEAHKLQLRGHTLCWNADRYLPKWLLAREFTRAEVETLLREHIRTVVGRYRGRIKYWDVVNEAVANDNRPGAKPLFDGFWNKHLGDDYIALAFRFAHEADPGAVLFYNDYDHGDGLGAKSDRIYRLLKKLLAAGVPVHGVGLQMHCNLRKPPVRSAVLANLQRLGALGLRVHITELDVDIMGAPGSVEERLVQQATVYRDIVSAAVESKVCDAIVTWGFSDKFIQRGLNIRNKRPENAPTLLWLFDAEYQPKLAYTAVAEALRARR
jgi:endo-1,4-beta-xylanase